MTGTPWHLMPEREQRQRLWDLPTAHKNLRRAELDVFGGTLRNVLMRAGCPSGFELQQASDADLMRIRNLGRGGVEKIRRLYPHDPTVGQRVADEVWSP